MKESVEAQIIDEKDINTIPNEPKKCNTCKTGKDAYDKVRKTQKILVLVSFYFLFATIYGTVKLIQELLQYFGH
jgi:hypothetical protein